MKSTNGLNLKRTSFVMMILSACIFALTILCAIATSNRYNRIELITDEYIQIQLDINSVKDASNDLTLKSRQYVMTGDPEFALNYFDEVNVVKRREMAVEDIRSMPEGDFGTLDDVLEAVDKSNLLMGKEVYAMSLVAYSSENKNILPAEIVNYELPEEDKLLTKEEAQAKAYDIMFGRAYSEEKLSIDASISHATDDLLYELEIYKEECTKEYRSSSVALMVILFVVALVFILIAVSFVLYVLKPLYASIEAIKQEKSIPRSKTYELNYLATTYNAANEKNATTRLHLKEKAEHDALTGLLNREAFDKLKDFYSDSEGSLAFLIMDIDDFKSVNDNFGHETGDAALIRVSDLLKECFRSNDFPIRFGGDEFVVIMTEIEKSQKGVIERKVNYINDVLKVEVNGLPKLSMSVGIAFSDHGFEDDLIERADKALYQTKKKGKNGYTFAE